MDGADKEEVRSFFERLISAASKIVGAAIGVGSNALLGNAYPGVLIGTYVAVSLEKIGKDVLSRQLGPRQEQRVAATITLAANLMRERLEQGHKVRDDDFFDIDINERSGADEIIEGLLILASQSFEEKKLPYISNFLANTCFNKKLDVETIHLIISLLNRISYRGLTLITISSQIDSFSFEIRPRTSGKPASSIAEGLSAEIYVMNQLGIFAFKEGEEDTTTYGILSMGDIEPFTLRLSSLGTTIFENCGLANIARNDTTLIKAIDILKEISLCPTDPPTLGKLNY